MRTFVIFLLTFLLGLILAEIIIWVFRHLIFTGSMSTGVFVFSKALSMLPPFFITYSIRRKFV